MAQIRMSWNEIDFLGAQCNMLAEKYAENIEETLKLLRLIDDAWDGAELGNYVQQLTGSIPQTQKAMEMLRELSRQFADAAESMRSTEQQITSQIRGIFE